jgi:amidase
MARTAEDVALMLQAIAGPTPLVPLYQPSQGRDFVAAVNTPPAKGFRSAYYPDMAKVGIDSEIKHICHKISLELSQIGAVVEDHDGDISFGWEPYLDLRGVQVIASHHHRLDQIEHFGPNLAGNLESGLNVTTQALGLAEQARSCLWELFHEFFQGYDFLLTPCVAVKPFPLEQHYPATIGGKQMRSYIDWVAPTFLLSLTGLPVASVPCGLTEDGLPVGLQIVGKPQGEEGVLALAKQIQMIRPIGLPW